MFITATAFSYFFDAREFIIEDEMEHESFILHGILSMKRIIFNSFQKIYSNDDRKTIARKMVRISDYCALYIGDFKPTELYERVVKIDANFSIIVPTFIAQIVKDRK